MDPMLFLNHMFQMAALNNFAMMLDKDGTVIEAPADWPEEAQTAHKTAAEAGESPLWVSHPEFGDFVTHDWDAGNDDEEDEDGEDIEDEEEDADEGLRMVCWAADGAGFNKTACDWWKAQGANPDTIEPGITTLHEPEPEPEEPAEPEEPPSREFAVAFIDSLGKMNPSGDHHGSIDPPFTKVCREFDADYPTTTPLTLEEWKGLTRDREDSDKPFARDIKDAVDPLVFLAVLRDRLVHTSGAAGNIIRMIGIVVDPHIEARTMTWREDQPFSHT